MGQLLAPITNLFRNHKLKILTFFVSLILFLVWLFPFEDIGDLVTTQISHLSGNQIYVSFDQLDLAVIPQPGLEMSKVKVETVGLPALDMGHLFVSTSILGLITFRPGVTAVADDIAGGKLSLSTRGGEKTKAGIRKQIVSVDAKGLNLEKVLELLGTSLRLKGSISTDMSTSVDTTFAEQPEGDFDFLTQELNLEGAQVPTPMGAFPLPNLKVSQLKFEGNMKSGKLMISRGEIGGTKNDWISGTITGQLDVQVNPGPGGSPSFQPGGYNFAVKLKVKPELEKEAGLILGFIEKYKRPAGNAADYSFRVSSQSFNSPPSLGPL